MPHAVGKVPSAANRVGLVGALPLHVRCDEARQRIEREIPPGSPEREAMNLSDSEFHWDRMLDAPVKYHERRVASAPQPSRWVQAALKVLYQERQQYHASWQELRELQRKAQRLAGDWQHALLGTLNDPAVFVVPGMINPLEDTSALTTEADVNSAIAEIKQQHDGLKTRLERLRAAMSFEAEGRDFKNMGLIQALWLRVQQLEIEIRGKSKKRKAA